MENLILPIENIFGSVGLTTPSKRMFFFSILSSAAEYYFKPSYAFNDDKTLRKSAFLSASPDATYIHFGTIPLIVGAISGLYI